MHLNEDFQALDGKGDKIPGFFILGTKYGNRGIAIEEMDQQVMRIDSHMDKAMKNTVAPDLEAKARFLGQIFASKLSYKMYRHGPIPSLLQGLDPDNLREVLETEGPEDLPFLKTMASLPRCGDSGDSILKHTLDIMYFVQMLGTGRIEEFNKEHEGWPMSQALGQGISKSISNLFDARTNRVFNLPFLLHDIGVCIQNPFHPEMGAIMAEMIMRKLRYSQEDINFVRWLVYHHFDLGTLFTAERTPRVIQEALEELPGKIRNKAKNIFTRFIRSER